MDDVYKNIEEYNPNEKRKILIGFDMIADMLSNKKLQPLVTELFIRGRKPNVSLVFITQSILLCQNFNDYFIMKIPNKRELQHIAINHSTDIDFEGFIDLLKNVLQTHILF